MPTSKQEKLTTKTIKNKFNANNKTTITTQQ